MIFKLLVCDTMCNEYSRARLMEIFLLLQYLKQFQLAPMFTEEEVHHWFTPRAGIVDSYVVEVGPAARA